MEQGDGKSDATTPLDEAPWFTGNPGPGDITEEDEHPNDPIDRFDIPTIFEFKELDGPKGKYTSLVISPEARKNWSDKTPRKFDPERAMLLISYVSKGCFMETAAQAAGISKVTLYAWMAKGADPSLYGSTVELQAWRKMLDQVAAQMEINCMGIILKASIDSWQACAWFLERRYPERWGRKDIVAHVGDAGPGSHQEKPKTSEEMFRDATKLIAELNAGDKDGEA